METTRRIVCGAATKVAQAICPDDLALLLHELPRIRRGLPVRNEQTNARLVLALIAAEDHRFLRHMGVELRSVLRAASGVLLGRFGGGSTIEQQLIRVVRGRYELSLGRKLTEIVLALALYRRFEKSDVARMYGEIAYYGWRGSGLKNIARRLDYELSTLTQYQAIMIMSLLKRPLPRNPSTRYLNKLVDRVGYVTGRFNEVAKTEVAHELVERARS